LRELPNVSEIIDMMEPAPNIVEIGRLNEEMVSEEEEQGFGRGTEPVAKKLGFAASASSKRR